MIAHGSDRPLAVGLALAAFNSVVGVLFLLRSGPMAQASVLGIAGALPSIVVSGIAYRLALPTWSLPLIVLHDAFAIWAIASLVMLGRSFAILPVRRELVARGPYRVVRNPIYLGEIGMITAACATRGWLFGLGAAALGALLVVPRVLLEERALGPDEAYAKYRAEVRYRLLPGLF